VAVGAVDQAALLYQPLCCTCAHCALNTVSKEGVNRFQGAMSADAKEEPTRPSILQEAAEQPMTTNNEATFL
jgi:hypothetical protein